VEIVDLYQLVDRRVTEITVRESSVILSFDEGPYFSFSCENDQLVVKVLDD
jgi:hypothetical protein